MKSIISTPAGNLLIECEGNVLLRCKWTTEHPSDRGSNRSEAETQLREYFAGERREFQVDYELRGTPFQCRVWRELLAIPYGETRTYGQIAAAIGCPGGSRAVAQACSRNNLCIIVPCHRVIAASGLGGYTAPNGLATKLHLLSLEHH